MGLNSFFYFFPIEKAGIFIAWFGIITRTIALVTSIPINIIAATFDCDDLINMFKEEGIIDFGTCRSVIITIYVILVAICFLFIGFVAIDLILIKGTRKRNYQLILPAVILYGSLTVVYFLLIFTFRPTTTTTAIFFTLIYGYFTVCLYSLYSLFRSETIGNETIPETTTASSTNQSQSQKI
ncbi:hypothetical protein PVAND_006238 [Polypedilum vanderplanki]|uniref:Uncharacterized protein n=1 Tax=Polypedilum vanderplanki TaxID=319348 RepID=A0A9J6C313_POLVA|nr:hypothetical protein PVAND_006238 [Polypedilum vanderplanki]